MKNTSLIIVALLFVIISCNQRPITIQVFDLYNSDNKLIESGKYSWVKQKSIDGDNIQIENKEGFLVDCFKQKVVEDKGIYRTCEPDDSRYSRTHSFVKNDIQAYCKNQSAFTHYENSCLGTAQYAYSNKNYIVYSFTEASGSHNFYSSYYLVDYGFICFYNFDSDRYLKARFSNQPELEYVFNKLINDSTFFERHIVPSYLRF